MRKTSSLMFLCIAIGICGCSKPADPQVQPADAKTQDVNKKLTNFESIPLPVPKDPPKKPQ